MSETPWCDKHGYYDPAEAINGGCPYCARELGARPSAPLPLDQEETGNFEPGMIPPTYAVPSAGDNDETILPSQLGKSPLTRPLGDLEETGLPAAAAARGVDMEATELPERKRRRILDGDEDEIEETVLDREDTSAMGWLFVKRSPTMRRGHIIRIHARGATIGRSPRKADILVDDEKVSGEHARLNHKEGQFMILDLLSSNGTWVNGEQISNPTPLKENDEIRIGDTVFVLKTL